MPVPNAGSGLELVNKPGAEQTVGQLAFTPFWGYFQSEPTAVIIRVPIPTTIPVPLKRLQRWGGGPSWDTTVHEKIVACCPQGQTLS